jgi:hypothetical protein
MNRRIFETIDISIRRLEEGRNLLIFPEIAVPDRNTLGEFITDLFIWLSFILSTALRWLTFTR